MPDTRFFRDTVRETSSCRESFHSGAPRRSRSLLLVPHRRFDLAATAVSDECRTDPGFQRYGLVRRPSVPEIDLAVRRQTPARGWKR